MGRGRGTPGVAPTSLVGLGTPLWWFRASSGGRGGARTPARWRGGAGRAPLDAARGAAPALPAAAERACLPEGAATHTASHTRLLREAGAAATPSPRPREGSTRRARAGRGDGVVTRPRRRGAVDVVSRASCRLAGARLCVISGPVLPRVVLGARPGHASPAKCEVARDAAVLATVDGQRRHASSSMLATRTAGRTARRPQTPNAQTTPVEGRCGQEARVTNGVEIKFHGAFVLNRRVVLHAVDAAPARWRGDAASSPLDAHPTHWLIPTQVKETSIRHSCLLE